MVLRPSQSFKFPVTCREKQARVGFPKTRLGFLVLFSLDHTVFSALFYQRCHHREKGRKLGVEAVLKMIVCRQKCTKANLQMLYPVKLCIEDAEYIMDDIIQKIRLSNKTTVSNDLLNHSLDHFCVPPLSVGFR